MALCAVLIANVVLAQAPDRPSGREAVPPGMRIDASIENLPPWTLAELESVALSYNPTLAQANAAVAQARGTMIQAGLYPNPQVGYLRNDPSVAGQSRTSGVFVGQEFVTAGKRQKSQAIESWEVQRLTWEQAAQQQRVINDLTIRFYETLGAQQSVAVSTELVKIAEAGLQTTERLLTAQHATRLDLLQARIQLNAVRLNLSNAEVRRRAAWTQLINVVGRSDLPESRVIGELDGEIPQLDWETNWQKLLAASPQLRAAESRIQHARSELTREQAQPIPNVTLQVVAQHDYQQNFDSVSTFLAVPVPVFDRNQGNIMHASADVREACAEVDRTVLALRDSLADGFRRYEGARNQVEELRKQILPDAKEALDLTIAGYQAGEFQFLQVLNARHTYFQASLAYVDALTEVRKVVTEIDGLLLTGGLNPAALGTALQSQPAGRVPTGLLNQVQSGSASEMLPPAIQTGAGP